MSSRVMLTASAGYAASIASTAAPSDPYYDKVSLLLNGDTDVDTNFANVSLLLTGNDLLDKSNVRSTITNTGSVSVSSTIKRFGTGSMYFSGSSTGAQGTILTVPTSSALDIKTGDFTIEMWIYTTSIQNYSRIFMINSTYTTGSVGVNYDTGTGKINFFTYDTGVGLPSLAAPAFNMWHHVAVTRSGSTFTLFLNGVLQATATNASAMYSTSTPYYTIGNGDASSGGYSPFTGYIDDLRITKGVARYTTNFTPPTQALPSHEILDSSVYRLPVTTYGNARIDTATKKFGTGSMYFDGTGDAITLSAGDFCAFGTGDFTIELQVNFVSVASQQLIYDSRPTSTNGTYPAIYIGAGGTLYYYANTTNVITGSTLVTNTWYHIAVARFTGSTKLYVNGVQVGSTYTDSINYLNGASRPMIGSSGYYAVGTDSPLYGYIDDLRVTKGYARYTANFTPPTATLPAIPPTIAADPWWGNVSLLLDGNTTNAYDPYWQNVSLMLTGDDFIDWSNQHNAITNNGTVTLSTNKKYNTSSLAFSGTKYLTMPSNTAFDFGTGDFTVECWVNFSTVQDCAFFQTTNIINVADGPFWLGYNGGKLYASRHGSASYAIGYTWTPSTGTWYHVAAIRQSGTVNVYLNGSVVATSSTLLNGVSLTQAGAAVGVITTPAYFQGYIADLRVTKGIARTITVPTTALPAFKIQDRTQNNLTVTPYGNVQLSTDVKKNGTGSMFFDGTGDYLGTPLSSNFIIGANDYTFEAWIMMADPTTGGCLYTDRVNSPDYSGIIINVRSGYLDIVVSINGSTWATNGWLSASGTQTIAANVWTHVAVCKTSNIWSMYVNGILSKTVTLTNNPTQSQSTAYLGYDPGGIPSFKGYIDDVRITKGYARYTQNFTPPSQSFATQYISTGFDPNYADVSLLLTGEGTNGSTTFTDLSSSPKTITAYGDAKISTAQKKYGTGSIAFDGTGDWLTLDGSSNFAYGTGDFTIEVWIQTSNWGSGTTIFYDQRPLSTDGNYPCIYTQAGQLRYFVNSADRITGSTLTTNTWYHIAVCRSGTSTKMFLNGVQDGSTYSDSTTYINGASRPIIATRGYNPGDNTFLGYIDDLRITKGIARYTTSFTPPTYALATTTGTPFDVNRSSTSLLLRGNGTNGSTSFTDESPNNLTVTNTGSVTVNTTTKKYGTGSMAVSGSGQYLTIPSSSNLAFGTGDFTVEFWYNSPNVVASNYPVIYGNSNSGAWATNSFVILSSHATIPAVRKFMLEVYNMNNAGNILTSTTTVNDNTWYHVAVTRNGSTFRLFVNGVVEATYTSSASVDSGSASTAVIGGTSDPVNQSPCYIDDLRVTKGYARYTANFTPPTYEDPIVTGTQYDYNYAQVSLLLNGDGTNGSTSFTDLSSMPKTITAYGNAQISTGTKKYGTGSLAFDGTGDYLSVASLPLNIAQPYTIEYWMYLSTNTSMQIPFSNGGGAGSWSQSNGHQLLFYYSSSALYYQYNYGNAAIPIVMSASSISTLTWYHVAVTYDGTTTRLFVNGTSQSTSTNTPVRPTTYNLTYVGYITSADASYFNGYIDDLRVTQGLARYTQNFTPPTAPLPTSLS